MDTDWKNGPFRAKDFEQIEVRLVPAEMPTEYKKGESVRYEFTKSELYEWCADIANKRFKEIIEAAPVVTGKVEIGEGAFNPENATINLALHDRIVKELTGKLEKCIAALKFCEAVWSIDDSPIMVLQAKTERASKALKEIEL